MFLVEPKSSLAQALPLPEPTSEEWSKRAPIGAGCCDDGGRRIARWEAASGRVGDAGRLLEASMTVRKRQANPYPPSSSADALGSGHLSLRERAAYSTTTWAYPSEGLCAGGARAEA